MRWFGFHHSDRIVHICGHIQFYKLQGRKSARRREAVFLSCRPCPSCSTKGVVASLAASANVALPDLLGDEAACAAAESIRKRLLYDVDQLVKSAELGADPLIQAVVSDLRSQTQANWWIDHHDTEARQLIAERGRYVLGLVR